MPVWQGFSPVAKECRKMRAHQLLNGIGKSDRHSGASRDSAFRQTSRLALMYVLDALIDSSNEFA